MITTISKLKSFGIFQDYKASKDLKSFVQYNIFYGWNGSGKSTLAKVFVSINDKRIHSDFPDGQFSVSLKNLTEITHLNLTASQSNVRVFSKDFIQRNVNFEDSKTNSILILSGEKKDEKERYLKLQNELSEKQSMNHVDSEKYHKNADGLKKNLSKWAGNVKRSFELLETSNTYYLNYDRTKLSTFIRENREKIKPGSILKAEEVKNLRNTIKPNRKLDIAHSLPSLDISEINVLFGEIKHLIGTSIFSKQIERLASNSDINQWVRDGLSIHNKHESKECEFCGQSLPPNRVEHLNNHFSTEYESLIQNIQKLKIAVQEFISLLRIPFLEMPLLYDEFHPKYENLKNIISIHRADCITEFDDAMARLAEKEQHPFVTFSYNFRNLEQTLETYNHNVSFTSNLIEQHNAKNEGFDATVKAAQGQLELHFVSEILTVENYDGIEEGLVKERNAVELLDRDITNLAKQVTELEAVLLNEAIGAEEFNKNLEKFIGRKDISLQFDKNLKGYRLLRKGKTQPAKNLSEGEKTAIALVFFMSKLRENGNRIEDTIILLDDPISSFDSNHLFHSYSYVKKECEQSLQLFILTHNFQYFKLIRDWLHKKNQRKKKLDGTYEEKIRTNIYSIECSAEEERKAAICNGSETLIKFNSEYHYIFHKLVALGSATDLDLEKAFLIANLARKLLEAFLTFKFPKGRDNFNELLQAGCPDGETCEKVYRFINKYSHNELIDFNEGPIDNLLSEGSSIIISVFKIVKDLDEHHYNEMKEICA